jgi:hypothetical protein
MNGNCHNRPHFIYKCSPTKISTMTKCHLQTQTTQLQVDSNSMRSTSSEDISGSIEGHCCSAEARNPAIKSGRQLQLLQMIILPFIPILALIVQTSVSLNEVILHRAEVAEIEEQVTKAMDLGKLVTRLQMERSHLAFYVFTNGSTLR